MRSTTDWKRVAILFVGVWAINLTPLFAGKPDKQPPPEESSAYTLIDLQGLAGGPSGRIQSDAEAISELDSSGNLLVVGRSNDGEFHPVVWTVASDDAFVITDLVPLGAPTGWYSSNINDAGVVVLQTGQYLLPGPDETVADLDPPAGEDYADASSINNVDEITGSALWTPGAEPISLGGFYARDISDNGLMVGDELSEAVIAELVAGNLEITPLGVLPGHSSSQAYAISNDGTYVVGASYGPDGAEAFLWSETTGMIGLGKLGGINSAALDVNNSGQVVGYFETRSSPTAFLWETGQMVDLNAIVDVGRKRHLTAASGINDAGHIVGLMRIDIGRGDSEEHGFLLRPSPSSP